MINPYTSPHTGGALCPSHCPLANLQKGCFFFRFLTLRARLNFVINGCHNFSLYLCVFKCIFSFSRHAACVTSVQQPHLLSALYTWQSMLRSAPLPRSDPRPFMSHSYSVRSFNRARVQALPAGIMSLNTSEGLFGKWS